MFRRCNKIILVCKTVCLHICLCCFSMLNLYFHNSYSNIRMVKEKEKNDHKYFLWFLCYNSIAFYIVIINICKCSCALTVFLRISNHISKISRRQSSLERQISPSRVFKCVWIKMLSNVVIFFFLTFLQEYLIQKIGRKICFL